MLDVKDYEKENVQNNFGVNFVVELVPRDSAKTIYNNNNNKNDNNNIINNDSNDISNNNKIKSKNDDNNIVSKSKSKSKLTFHVKKIIAAISATKFLPKTHKLRASMENGGSSSFIGAFNIDQKKRAMDESRNLKVLGSSSDVNEKSNMEIVSNEDDMWDSPKVSTKLRNIGTMNINRNSDNNNSNNADDDDDIFATKTKKQKMIDKKSKKNDNNNKNNNNKIDIIDDNLIIKKDFNIIDEVDDCLLQILSEVLKVDLSTLRKDHIKEEIDYVFSTWRRPHLLLDYYRMHSSTPEIQNNFRRQEKNSNKHFKYYSIVYYIISYDIILYPIISYYIISYYITSYYIILYYIILYYIISYYIILYFIIM